MGRDEVFNILYQKPHNRRAKCVGGRGCPRAGTGSSGNSGLKKGTRRQPGATTQRGPARVTAGLTFPYDSVYNQPAWVQFLGKVQGSLCRVLIGLEVHVGFQPQLVL